jgi:putative lipoic acid-binding regulatory protein
MNEDIFKFPCDYPIKVFGLNQPDLIDTVSTIVERYVGKLHSNQITLKNSSKRKYVSVTIRIIATSRKQLDSINEDLQNCPLVSYLL